MSQRLYIDYDRSFYDSEPITYRDKTSKMAEIQTYVNILIQNNRVYADQLNAFRRENTEMRGQIEVMIAEMLMQKQKYEQLLIEKKAEYNKEAGRLIDELKDILNKKQQMEGSYKALLEQLSYQSEFDKKSRGIQLEQIQRNYENKIKILNDRIAEQNREIQKNFYLQSDNKLRMVQEIDSLNYEACQLKKENTSLRQAHSFGQGQFNRLSTNIKLLNREKEQMGVSLLKIQQQKNQSIIELKQTMGQLRQQLNDQIENINKLETTLLTKQKELQQLINKHDYHLKDKNECEEYSNKLEIELNEKQHELTNLSAQYARLSDFSSKELKRMSQLIRVLEIDNTKLGKQKLQFGSQGRVRQQQIYTLLDQVQNLQAQNESAKCTMRKIEQSNLELKRDIALLRDQFESVVLQLKNEQEKCQLQMNHILTLEQLLEKEKKKNMFLENNSIDNHFIAKQVPGELSKKYEFEIQDILRRGEYEKSQIISRFQLEKERLIRMYEKALREKEILFKQKIVAMQNEIRLLSN